MMLDADKMVAAAGSRNPTLAGALTRLQRSAFSGSWEVLLPPIGYLAKSVINVSMIPTLAGRFNK